MREIWLILIAISALGALGGDLLLRRSQVLLGTACYAANGLIVYWIFCLRKDLISLVSVWLGIYLLASVAVGCLMLGEEFGVRKIIGVACALAAIFLCE